MISKRQPEAAEPESHRLDSRTLSAWVPTALTDAVRNEIEKHHRAGNPVAIWREGQVMLLYPDGSLRPADGETGEGETDGSPR